MKPRTQTFAKGGYHAPLSNAAGEHFHFFGACISVFPEGINDPWPALSLGQKQASNAISSSPRGRNGKLIIEEQCENSPQKRAKDNLPNGTEKSTKNRGPIQIFPRPLVQNAARVHIKYYTVVKDFLKEVFGNIGSISYASSNFIQFLKFPVCERSEHPVPP